MANMKIANTKSTRICAFCRYWNDPANSAIVPKQPQAGFWEFDRDATRTCVKRGFEMQAWTCCNEFLCKF